MQIPFPSLAQDSVLQIRDAMRRVKRLHEALPQPAMQDRFWGGCAELPQPDAPVWADTEIDVRQVVL